MEDRSYIVFAAQLKGGKVLCIILEGKVSCKCRNWPKVYKATLKHLIDSRSSGTLWLLRSSKIVERNEEGGWCVGWMMDGIW